MPTLPCELLVLVRHGESARNAARRGNVFFPDEASRTAFMGQPDPATPLTDEGIVQARELGVRLREAYGSFDIAFDSGYRRTKDTLTVALEAWPDAERLRIERRSHFLLRERDTGYAVNMTTAEASAAFPWLQDYWCAEGPFVARPPGGESLAEVAARVQQFLELHRDALAGRRVLLVTHAGTLRMFRFLLEGWSHEEVERRLRDDPMDNCLVMAYGR
ncbi:MAG: histidine phosphatase family protein [Acidobacteria bacterium]|nr:histidine phosphatase family protein [Acidobacteriota bacterium]